MLQLSLVVFTRILLMHQTLSDHKVKVHIAPCDSYVVCDSYVAYSYIDRP